jgi:hypothetical protein
MDGYLHMTSAFIIFIPLAAGVLQQFDIPLAARINVPQQRAAF